MFIFVAQVNDEDVSSLSHEDALAAFNKAKEPILITVLRKSSKRPSSSQSQCSSPCGSRAHRRKGSAGRTEGSSPKRESSSPAVEGSPKTADTIDGSQKVVEISPSRINDSPSRTNDFSKRAEESDQNDTHSCSRVLPLEANRSSCSDIDSENINVETGGFKSCSREHNSSSQDHSNVCNGQDSCSRDDSSRSKQCFCSCSNDRSQSADQNSTHRENNSCSRDNNSLPEENISVSGEENQCGSRETNSSSGVGTYDSRNILPDGGKDEIVNLKSHDTPASSTVISTSAVTEGTQTDVSTG